MVKYIRGLCCLFSMAGLFLVTAPAISSATDHVPGAVLVKFHEHSATLAAWLQQGRRGTLPIIQRLFGAHGSKGFIGDATLTALRKSRQTSLLKSSADVVHNLGRIALIEFSAASDVHLLAAKLGRLPDVEYAELLPRHHISAIPNDPLLDDQYHLSSIRAFEAWDVVAESRPMRIAIIDTGLDFAHEDLAGVPYINPGEDGLDAEGNSRRSNRIDDDGNGFVDDWRGWDFVNGSEAGDNDPSPGNGHGTHVAGIAGALVNNNIGVAGSTPWVKIIPVKVGPDNSRSLEVARGYEAILYAAALGADVINCSWGGSTKSIAEQEIINTVIDMGVVIIAAAGNNNVNRNFYPASYDNVISVASVDRDDFKSSFSNFHFNVDISAPGTGIFSTFAGNDYSHEDGTSMAAPMVAAAAALVKAAFPNLSPVQIGEHLKATAKDISATTRSFPDMMGRGKLDMLAAVSRGDTRSIVLEDFEVYDANNNGLLEPGEDIEIGIAVHNVLAPVVNAKIDFAQGSAELPQLEFPALQLGAMATGDRSSVGDDRLRFRIPEQVPTDFQLDIKLDFSEESGTVGKDLISLILNPSYLTLDGNDITLTINSIGNLGFNDYPSNAMGDGFLYRGGDNLIFEGALMVGRSERHLSNVARATFLRSQERSFLPIEVTRKQRPGLLAPFEAVSEYGDTLALGDAGVRVRQVSRQFDEAGHRDYVLLSYEITNSSGSDFDELFVGLFCDLDIGATGLNNIAAFDYDRVLAYVFNPREEGLPYVGMQMLNDHDVNFYAISNNSRNGVNLYDGFSRAEKWFTLSSGIAKESAGITDVSTVISAGPISLKQNTAVFVSFSIFAGESLAEMHEHADSARARAIATGIGSESLAWFPRVPQLKAIYPNPGGSEVVTIEYELSRKVPVLITLSDLLGRSIVTVLDEEQRAGDHTASFDAAALAVGAYLIQFRTFNAIETIPFAVTR